jgi:hypothetical protein
MRFFMARSDHAPNGQKGSDTMDAWTRDNERRERKRLQEEERSARARDREEAREHRAWQREEACTREIERNARRNPQYYRASAPVSVTSPPAAAPPTPNPTPVVRPRSEGIGLLGAAAIGLGVLATAAKIATVMNTHRNQGGGTSQAAYADADIICTPAPKPIPAPTSKATPIEFKGSRGPTPAFYAALAVMIFIIGIMIGELLISIHALFA